MTTIKLGNHTECSKLVFTVLKKLLAFKSMQKKCLKVQ